MICIRLRHGFIYPVAIMAWYSCYVLSFFLTTLDSDFGVNALQEALKVGTPEVFSIPTRVFNLQARPLRRNFYQLGQRSAWMVVAGQPIIFFVERLWRTVKYERVYLNSYQTVPEAIEDIGKYFIYYNTERAHQTLDYKTPAEVYYGWVLLEKDWTTR